MTKRRSTLVQIRRDELERAVAEAIASQLDAAQGSQEGVAEPVADTIPEVLARPVPVPHRPRPNKRPRVNRPSQTTERNLMWNWSSSSPSSAPSSEA